MTTAESAVASTEHDAGASAAAEPRRHSEPGASLLASKKAKGDVIETLITVGAVLAFLALFGFYIWGVFGGGREKTKAVDPWVAERFKRRR